tara:strand:- start:1454 stop:1825 length:372 start_codon:yes stop_codon:yes gene_type:complete
MLWEFYELLGIDVSHHKARFSLSVLCIVLCILFGCMASQCEEHKVRYFMWSSIFFAAMLWNVLSEVPMLTDKRNAIPFAFLGMWTLYPIAFWMEKDASNLSFNVLDIVSKGVFGMVVAASALS